MVREFEGSEISVIGRTVKNLDASGKDGGSLPLDPVNDWRQTL